MRVMSSFNDKSRVEEEKMTHLHDADLRTQMSDGINSTNSCVCPLIET